MNSPAKITGAEALIRALEELGVEQVFGLPGVQNIELYDALLASSISHVLARHEQAAVHMADGYARATGKVGLAFATSGPGATNTVTGIATAYMDSVPLVVVTGQVSTMAIGTDAFQEADITTITLPITKHSYLLKDVHELVPAVFQAFYLATSGRPGPVLIDVPGNVAASELFYQAPRQVAAIPSYKPTIKGNARQVKAAAALLARAERPVLLVGGGVVSSGAAAHVLRLAELFSIPVATTLLAKGVMGSSHPLFLGQPGVYGVPCANVALQESDLLIAVGTRFSERVTGEVSGFAPRARVIHIDIDPAEIGKNVRVDVPIVGDAATVLGALTTELETLVPPGAARASRTHAHEAAGRFVKDESPTPSSSGPQALRAPHKAGNLTCKAFTVLGEVLKGHENVIITTDVGQHQLWASHLLATEKPRHFLTSGGLGTMGFGLPAALGAQLACPASTVLCVSGDGSFQMNLQEMAVASVHNLPVKIAIINNQSLGLVRQWQELFLEKRYAHTLLSCVPDYLTLAAAYGWQARTLNAEQGEGDMRAAFEWLLVAEGPALLNLVVPTSDLLEPMVRPGGTLLEVL